MTAMIVVVKIMLRFRLLKTLKLIYGNKYYGISILGT